MPLEMESRLKMSRDLLKLAPPTRKVNEATSPGECPARIDSGPTMVDRLLTGPQCTDPR